jgi:DNA primase
VVYGNPHEVRALLGEHTAYVERTPLTWRQINGPLVRKSLSYSKQLKLLQAACCWEDWVYNVTHPLKTLRQEREVG